MPLAAPPPGVEIAGKKKAPPTNQPAASRNPPGSTKNVGPSKSSQQPPRSQALAAPVQGIHLSGPDLQQISLNGMYLMTQLVRCWRVKMIGGLVK